MRDHVRKLLDPGLMKDLDAVVRAHGQECLLVGATAFEFSEVKLPRVSLDVDFAITVDSLDDLRLLEADLEEIGMKKTTPPCTYRYKDTLKIDIIPFGGISLNGRLHLPEMNEKFFVHGFREALKDAIVVPLECGITLKVARLPAVFVLKSFAFHDRKKIDDMDDIDAILKYYRDSPDYQAFYDLNNHTNMDFEDIGIWMLGRCIGEFLEKETAEYLTRAWDEILADDSPYYHAFPRQNMLEAEEGYIFIERLSQQIRILLDSMNNTTRVIG